MSSEPGRCWEIYEAILEIRRMGHSEKYGSICNRSMGEK